MSMKQGAFNRFQDGSVQQLAYDLYSGTITGISHFPYFVNKFVRVVTGTKEESEPLLENPPDLKVVGVGFGRTGTYSLTLALEELGFPTLHTQHLYENDAIQKMWHELVFYPSYQAGHAELGTPDWEALTSRGYVATMDFPTSLYYEQIMEAYPDCKFILTTRDSSERWFQSWDTLTQSITGPAYYFGFVIPGVRRYSIYLRWLFGLVNQDDSYLTSRMARMDQNRSAAIASYEAHNAKVRATIPSDRLLEYSVKQGWEPLCDFLEVSPCPTDLPFPKTNSARSVQVQSVMAVLCPIIVVCIVIFALCSNIFVRLTGRTVVGWVQYQFSRLPYLVEGMLLSEKERQERKQQVENGKETKQE